MSTVVVVGSVNVDLVAVGERMPLPGETVSMSHFTQEHGGKGANQAAAAVALGAKTHLVGAVGDDHWGTVARRQLADRGVRVEALTTVAGPTGTAIILVDGAGENSIAIVPGANAAVTPDLVTSALADVTGDAVVVACLEIPLDAVHAAATAARTRGWRFVLNPAPAQPLPDSLLGLVSVLTPNQTEVSTLGGTESLLATGVEAVVVTHGGAGCTVHVAGADPVPVPPCAADVVDTTGAGDAFTAGLAVALADGQPLAAAVRWAAAAGAIATEGLGAQGSLPTPPAVAARLASG
ncbi:ribokinase [Phytohabitans flavus]|uniref:Ribokinase n=1 Tax=Phytohabitans flavus TaxID=1076124 RepID=A0A6F8XVV5_9ACTN|nr:ribokinase [Phytohabitans flavus]BCB77992.1 ribokinase [Phytohabitans flavus]